MIIYGTVVSGLGSARTLGYPTANLAYQEVALPLSGVYASRSTVKGQTYNSLTVIGARQQKGQPLVEVLLLEFEGELYGMELKVELLDKLSEIEHFESEAELLAKIKNDIAKARRYFLQ